MTALDGLCDQLYAKQAEVEAWLEAELTKQPVPFYCSVDLRVSEHKIAPVDANLFPGGFNNLAKDDRPAAAEAIKELLSVQWPDVRCIALVVERQTRNPYYAQHLQVLRDAIAAAGMQVKPVFLDGEPATLKSHHSEVEVGVLRREGKKLSIDGCDPDMVLLNHDQSGGVPEILADSDCQIVPILEAGWSKRRKSVHFFQYERAVSRFARAFDVDSWLLQAYFNVCNRVDVSKSIGLDCLARAIDETLIDINDNYQRVGATDQPFVVLKADAGTYGMGVVMVDDAESAKQLNRRQRKDLSVGKDGVAVSDILIQEGVASNQRVEGLVAEPVCYMIGTKLIGGFWRLNQAKGPRANLNSKGMLFWPQKPAERATKIGYVQQVVARLALLATARELASELVS